MSPKQQRLVTFDVAKAICIILVVIGHYAPASSPAWYHEFHDWIYTFHMPLFMFASGYIYIAFKKDEEYRFFIWKKIKRLMIPYFTTSIIIISIKLLSQKGMYVENPVGITSYIKMFYLPEAGYFLWFIWALFLIYVFMPLFSNKKTRTALFFIAIILHYAFPFTLTKLFCISQAANMLIWFTLGVMIFDWKECLGRLLYHRQYSIMMQWFILSVFICASLLADYNSEGVIMAILPWLGIGGVMSLSSLLTCYMNKRIIKPLLSIGSSSYIIYLFHTTFEGFAKSFIHKLPVIGGNDNMMFIIGCCLVVVTGIIGPMLLHKYILNKSQVTRFLFGLK